MDTTHQILKAIQHKIRHKRSDTLWDHVKTYFSLNYFEYNGSVKGNDFAIWSYDQLGGVFYPVFFGKVVIENNIPLIRATTKLNAFGFLLSILIAAVFFYSFLLRGDHLDYSLRTYFVSLITLSLLIIAFRLGYSHQRKIAIAAFTKLIKEVAADSQIIIN